MKSLIILFNLIFNTYAADNLYLGDSHSYLYGVKTSNKRLGNIIIDHYDKNLDYLAACGSRPNSWVSGKGKTSCGYTEFLTGNFENPNRKNLKKIDQIVGTKQYQNFIINFGDNMLLWNKNTSPWQTKGFEQKHIDYRFKEISTLLNSVSFEQCFWIGPTYNIPGSHYHKQNQHIDDLYEIISEAIKPFDCELIDSRILKIERSGDGIHHGGEKSRDWGEMIIRSLP